MRNEPYSVAVALQPIVALVGGAVHAYESLLRPAGGGSPEALFRGAIASRRLQELELAALTQSFAALADIEPQAKLFVNIHPLVLENDDLADAFLDLARDSDLSRVVVEITEHAPIGRGEAAMRNVRRLRAAGIAFALDDVGSGFSHLRWIEEIAPVYLKASGALAGGFERSSARAAALAHLQEFAIEHGCTVIVEGIETAATARAAARLGIRHGQGYHFGRPLLVATEAAA